MTPLEINTHIPSMLTTYYQHYQVLSGPSYVLHHTLSPFYLATPLYGMLQIMENGEAPNTWFELGNFNHRTPKNC